MPSKTRMTGAASAKNPSAVSDQTSVARVLKPIGPSKSVIGSSLRVVTKTRMPPAVAPPRTSGSVTVRSVASQDLPRLREASSSDGCTCSSEVRILPYACGRKRMR